MSEYRRFFSYIYACEKHKKTSNAGFAKIEIKGPMTTIELHMRNAFLPAPAACLYLFVRNGESIQGFPLGDVPFSNGNADWRFTLNQPQLGESDYKISDAAGILFLLGDDVCFVSQWDEAPIDWASFQIYDEPHEEANEQSNGEADRKTDDQANEDRNAQTDGTINAPADGQNETPADETDDSPFDENVIRSTELPQPDISLARRQFNPSPQGSWSDTWQELLATQEVRKPFLNENIRCIRIELKDLRVLPPSNWHLCNNSFLLHAFFTYRHLILGEISSEKHSQWFVGVPGIQYRQEHVLAAIFGFSDFLPDKDSAGADAPFGYWYRTISEED